MVLDDLIDLTRAKPFPGSPEKLEEGLHYYMENNMMVMTEFYLLSRDYCCDSGCRHCPYGPTI